MNSLKNTVFYTYDNSQKYVVLHIVPLVILQLF